MPRPDGTKSSVPRGRAPPPRTRSDHLSSYSRTDAPARGRSASPTRLAPPRARSDHVSGGYPRGRPSSPNGLREGRRMPPPRTRSDDLSQMRAAAARGRSMSPSRMRNPAGNRGRSMSPSRMRPAGIRSRSTSPSRMRAATGNRGRSMSPSRMRGDPRGRSASPRRPPPRGRARSVDPLMNRRDRMMDNSNHSAGSFVIEKSADGRILARETGDPLEDEWEVVPNRRRLRRPNLKQVRQKGKQLHKSFRKISKKESFSWCKVCSYCAPILVLIMAAIGLVFATGAVQISSDDGAPTNTLDSSDITDPFEGEDVPQWPSNGAGLEVEIVNALSKELDVIFDSVTSDWDLGNPDGVTLFTQKEGQDAGCKPISGKIKACNGDYGGTKWRGSTDTMLNSDGEIESSTVRLNNFYLVPDTRGAWQYTLCHEIGHSLGLKHLDEDFDNVDLGSCMDYTENLEKNQHPNTMNYETLVALYGSVSGRRLRGGNANAVHTIRQQTPAKPAPDHIQQKRLEAVRRFVENSEGIVNHEGWTLVDRKNYGEEHELDLGDGYKVRVHKLLA